MSEAGAPAYPIPAELGEVIGGYRLTSMLSRGGMGCVYKAEHVRLGRIAAVKVLASHLAADQVYLARFFREARVVNSVRHRNIIDIFDFVEMDNPRRVACIMEYVDGATLRKAIRARGRMSLAEAIDICLQLVSALEAVHAVGVIHRDLKPTNIILTGDEDARGPKVKVLDFGIAKVENAASGDHKTASGTMLGTPAYMAPEQVASDQVSAATDVYALGELFYELVTGRRAFLGSRAVVLKAKILGEVPELTFPPGIGPVERIRSLVERCLSHQPEPRPTLGEFRAALGEISVQKDSDQGMELIAPATLPIGLNLDAPLPPVPEDLPVAPPLESTVRIFAPAAADRTGSEIISATTIPVGVQVPSEAIVVPPAAGRRWRNVWIAAILGCSTGAAVIFWAPWGREASPVRVAEPVRVAADAVPVAADAVPVAPEPVAVPARVEVPAPPVASEVVIESKPRGAKVIEAETSRLLGTTPVTVRISAAKKVELRLNGYVPRAIELSPTRGAEDVTLVKKPKPVPLADDSLPDWEEP